MHALLSLVVYLLVLYSNVEIFFTKINTNEYFNKNLMVSTTQYSSFKNFYQQDFCLTRTSNEVFFQKATDSVKLLIQNIKEYKASYNDLMAVMYELNYERMSKDSLVMNFTFSKTKYAQSRGYDSKYYPDLVKGKYIFYAADSIKMFTVKL
ncbi:MAG: hypothetical protein EOP34_04885 [Rickettsiales bacterium]|nr:MAG: hypothetical protein EOP34_04885 [Rickettsiales bacterium]